MNFKAWIRKKINYFLRYIESNIRLEQLEKTNNDLEEEIEDLKKKLASDRRKWISITIIFLAFILLWLVVFQIDECDPWVYVALFGIKAFLFLAILVAFVNVCKLLNE